jgi:SAM-dependent methyltransferase
MSVKVIKNRTCRMCTSTQFETVIDVGKHPLVNSLIAKSDLGKKDPVFPLVVKQCKKCGLVQLVDIIDAAEIYKNVDYLYFSSDMPGLDKYFQPYAEDVLNRFLTDKNDLVVEIGSNDGILLNLFKDKARILGVDPATNVVLRALRRGIPTLPLFFSQRLAEQILNEWGAAKAIIGNNCIAHLNDLDDLLSGVRHLLAPDGVFIVECNYWGGMVKSTNYSLIYHDHYSYFSVKVWQQFSRKYGMRVFDALVTPAQGGSLRMFLCKDERDETDRLKALVNEEETTRLNSYQTSLHYRQNVLATVDKLHRIVTDIKKDRKSIAGYGAAAKGFTILKCSKLGAKHLDYFVDDSPAKQGWYTPVDHIPIVSRTEAEKHLPDYFIILAPNYAQVILEKEENSPFRKRGGKFIVPTGNIDIL